MAELEKRVLQVLYRDPHIGLIRLIQEIFPYIMKPGPGRR